MIARRDFIAATAAALAVVAAPGGARVVALAADAQSPYGHLGTWLRLGQDGFVDVFTDKVEVGMGVTTGLAQVVAEELDLPVARIRIHAGDTDASPDQGGVGGSWSTEFGARPLRNAAAEARRVLVAAAATQLGVPAQTLAVKDGVVRDPASGRTVAYPALVSALAAAPSLAVNGKAFLLNVTGEAKPKDPSQYSVVGSPVARIDVAPKATAQFRYVVDVKLPGMLHARILRPPAVGQRPIAVDESSLRGHGDARLARVGDLLAVVATREWDAVTGARDLKVRWSAPSATFPAMKDLAQFMWEQPAASSDKVHAKGDLDGAFHDAAVVEATYFWPFQAHATMGPGCAVADVRREKTTVWSGTQKPHGLKVGIAKTLGIPVKSVRVVFVEDAGSYGRSGFDDTALDAALISRAVGKPVRVQYMRSDMTQWGPKGPAIVARARGAVRGGAIAGLDLTVRSFNGNEIASHPDTPGNFIGAQQAGHPNDEPGIEYAVYGKESGAYEIPALHAVADVIAPLAPTVSPLRTTHLRDPEGPGTTFVVESFVDELAAKAKADPIAFRIAHLKDERHKNALRVAAKTANWEARAAAAHARTTGVVNGRGVAFATRNNTVVATIAEVAVDTANGKVHVTRLVCAHDCGLIVNPRSLKGTIEANLMQSLSRTLFEEVRFDEHTVTSRDWATYPVVRTPDVPDRVDVVMIERKGLPPYGAGEPSSRPTAAAVANAIYDATGVRVRTAPMTPANVLAALRMRSA
jgi:CO/xanthine dehydrogenase Mo-binding subunit